MVHVSIKQFTPGLPNNHYIIILLSKYPQRYPICPRHRWAANPADEEAEPEASPALGNGTGVVMGGLGCGEDRSRYHHRGKSRI